jgi:hypothetical protein
MRLTVIRSIKSRLTKTRDDPVDRSGTAWLALKSYFKSLVVVLMGGLAIAARGEARAQQRNAPVQVGVVTFDIPAQPLSNALFSFTAKAGIEVFVDDALISGHMSTFLHGTYAPEVALRMLLAGTGLQIRRAASNAFTIVAANVAVPSMGWRPSWAIDGSRLRFYAALQGSVRRAICDRAATAPGPYRAALAIWVSSAGTINAIKLLTVDIDEETGRALVSRLKGISIGLARPNSVTQPIVFVVLPRSSNDARDCARSAGNGH